MKQIIITMVISLIVMGCNQTRLSLPESNYGTLEYYQNRLNETEAEITKLSFMPEPIYPESIKVCGHYYKKDYILDYHNKHIVVYKCLDWNYPSIDDVKKALEGKRIGLHNSHIPGDAVYIELYDRLDGEIEDKEFFKEKIVELENAMVNAVDF